MRPVSSSSGFTILEVLVSLSIFTIAALGIAKAYTDHLSTNTTNERKSEAIAAAQQVLDGLRLQDPALLPTSGSAAPTSISLGARTYQVTVSYCADSTYCTSNNIRHLRTVVRLNGTTMYQVDTVFAQLR